MSRLISIALVILLSGCNKGSGTEEKPLPEFLHETRVTITGYNGDAMEPFITKDDRYLFFNNLEGAGNKDIFYAEKVNDTVFAFIGEVQGVNTSFVDANPTMDRENRFYFISTRDLANSNRTIYSGHFSNGIVTGLHQVEGSINIPAPWWINMGVEISGDGELMFVSHAKFSAGAGFPEEGNIRFAVKEGDRYNIPDNEGTVLANINNDESIQYAGELSADKKELFFSEVTLSDPPLFRLFYAVRKDTTGIFGDPVPVLEPFRENAHAVVEAPTLSADGRRLYYHKKDARGIYAIYMLTRQ